MKFKMALLPVVLFSPLLLGGCVALLAAGAGAGTVSYIEGVYSENVSTSMATAYHASIAGIKASDYALMTQNLLHIVMVALKCHYLS